MKFKILGGKIANESQFLKEKHFGKANKLQSIDLFLGNLTISYASEWGNPNVQNIAAKMTDCQVVTEENKVNFAGAAGWGVVGGLLTGGVGLLAGALLGGRGKATVCALQFDDGSQFLVSGKPKEVAQLMFHNK